MLKYKGLILACTVILVHVLAAFGAKNMVYKIYGGYVFPLIRYIYDYTIGLLPFGSVYWMTSLLIIWMIYWSKHKKITTQKNHIQQNMLKWINRLGWVIFLFYFLWGFNYYRPSLAVHQGWKSMEPDSNDLYRELEYVSIKVNQLRHKLSIDTATLPYHPDWTQMENNIRVSQKSLLGHLGGQANGRVRVRKLYPDGILLSLSTAGIYIPFACEGHIDPGLNAIQWPFTAAHEMAHGYGFTDEGECNFIGFVTCITSSDPYTQYSGWLGYWRYLFRAVDTFSEDKASRIYNSMDIGVQADLRTIRKDMLRYPDIMPWFRDVFYEFYLKSHGMTDGLASYDGIIPLVLSWKNTMKTDSL